MDFSAKLENLQAKVNETVETARAAANENRDQLKSSAWIRHKTTRIRPWRALSNKLRRPPIEPRAGGPR
jgi:ppGpp synthetase/RelA/SpoT-type nucleotidyltranferase